MIAAAPLAYADSNFDNFRALTAVEIIDDPLTATIKPIEVTDEASAAKGVLRTGDKIAFEVEGVEGATLYVLNMDSEGVIQMIYPNKFATADTPQAPQTADSLTLPAKDAKYEFQVSGDGGTEVVKFIAIKGDVTAFETLMGTLFDKKSAFPRAVQPAANTTKALSDFFDTSGKAEIRETTLQYVIAK
jgi:hypothetical protein